MKKTKATKQSGTIAYQLNPRYDLQGESTEKNPLMGVSVVASTPVTTKEMAERISHACTLLTRDIVERRLRTFFEDHPYIYRSQMEQVCECSKYLALKYLDELVDEGLLRALGRKNSRFYAPVPGGGLVRS